MTRKQQWHYYTHNNETMSLPAWAKKFGVPYYTLYSRIEAGMTFEQAIENLPRVNASESIEALMDRYRKTELEKEIKKHEALMKIGKSELHIKTLAESQEDQWDDFSRIHRMIYKKK